MSLKEFTEERLQALGKNPFEAARDAGLERTFVRDIIIGRKRSVVGSNVGKLAVALATTPEEIASAMTGGIRRPPAEPSKTSAYPAGLASTSARDVPVYGTAYAAALPVGAGKSSEGFALERGRIAAYVERTWPLAGVAGGYAIYIAGQSMVPSFRPGDLLYVNPVLPVRPDDEVVIVQRAGAAVNAFVKVFLGYAQNGDTEAQQLHPPALVTFARDTVISIDRIVERVRI